MIRKELLKYPVRTTPSVPTNHGTFPFPRLDHTWGKHAFSGWIESVKQTFKKGDLVCRKSVVDYGGKSCPYFYHVVDIQEIHYLAEIDSVRNIPKALGLRGQGSTVVVWDIPDDYRKLSANEVANANLRIKEEEERKGVLALLTST